MPSRFGLPSTARLTVQGKGEMDKVENCCLHTIWTFLSLYFFDRPQFWWFWCLDWERENWLFSGYLTWYMHVNCVRKQLLVWSYLSVKLFHTWCLDCDVMMQAWGPQKKCNCSVTSSNAAASVFKIWRPLHQCLGSFIYTMYLPTHTKSKPIGMTARTGMGCKGMLFSWQTYCHWRGAGFKSHNLLGNSMSSPKPNNLNYLKCFNQWNYQHNYINNANVNKPVRYLFPPKCRIACWWTIGSDEHESHMQLWHITQVFGSIRLLAVSFFNNGMSSHF